MGQRNIDTAADDEIQGVAIRGFLAQATPAVVEEICVESGVRAAESRLEERLEMSGANLRDRQRVIGEEIALRDQDTAIRASCNLAGWKNERLEVAAAIVLKITRDCEPLLEVERYAAS